MKRSHIRTPQGWARFDFFAIIILITLVIVLMLLWFAGSGPGNEDCCNENNTGAKSVHTATAPTLTPEPLPPKEPYIVIVNHSAPGVSVSGVVANDITRTAILEVLTETFLEQRPTSSLAVAKNIVEFDASLATQDPGDDISGNLKELIGILPTMEEAQLSIDPERIKLSGGASDQATLDRVSLVLARFENDERSVSNDVELIQDVIKEEESMSEAIDCAAVLRASQVEFQFGSATLTAAGKSSLRTAMECLSQENYDIVGHTDAIGNDDDNLALSIARAEAARNYLVSLGVSASRIRASGQGESQPIASNDTQEGRAQNRRIEFIAR